MTDEQAEELRGRTQRAEKALTIVLTALLRIFKDIRVEMERGYVLTYEPNAAAAWRARWNAMLSDVEELLKLAEKGLDHE
ncbi:MAG: hypothetical protein ACYDH4_09535 [Candidatus Cryosericum sp.]